MGRDDVPREAQALAETPSPMEPAREDATLVDLLDGLLEGGVMVQGDVTLSVAGVDLLYVGLRLVVKTPDETTP